MPIVKRGVNKKVNMSRNFLFLIALMLGLTMVTACATRPAMPVISDGYQPFVLERDLAGKKVARGEFKPIIGAARGFTAYLDGTWDGQTLTLVEDFEFDDGEIDRKTWRLTKSAENQVSGTREDVVGEALGFMDEGAFRLEYVVRLGGENGRGGRKVKFRDILYNETDGIVFNRASVGFYGLRVGTVTLKIEDAKTPEDALM